MRARRNMSDKRRRLVCNRRLAEAAGAVSMEIAARLRKARNPSAASHDNGSSRQTAWPTRGSPSPGDASKMKGQAEVRRLTRKSSWMGGDACRNINQSSSSSPLVINLIKIINGPKNPQRGEAARRFNFRSASTQKWVGCNSASYK